MAPVFVWLITVFPKRSSGRAISKLQIKKPGPPSMESGNFLSMYFKKALDYKVFFTATSWKASMISPSLMSL
jgi:hypothetical protein